MNTLILIPAAYIIAYEPVILRDWFSIKKGTFSNIEPREVVKSNDDSELGTKIRKAHAAHLNGMETAPLFGLAVLAANFAKVDESLIWKTGFVFLGSRIAHMLFYIYVNHSTPTSILRSSAFFVGLGSVIELFYAASTKKLI